MLPEMSEHEPRTFYYTMNVEVVVLVPCERVNSCAARCLVRSFGGVTLLLIGSS